MLTTLTLWMIWASGPPSFGAIVSVVFPILTIVAGGVAILAYGSNKVLRDTAADLRSRIADLEKDRTSDREKMNAQAAELKVWQRAVTGEVHLTAILDLLGDHHKEALREWARNRAAEGEMTEALHQLREAIEERMK